MQNSLKSIWQIFLLFLFLLNSCYSYKVSPKKYKRLENPNIPRKAFVINDTLSTELKILKSSNLFEITNDSINSEIIIRLYPIKDISEKIGMYPGNFILTVVTFGLLPAYAFNRIFFKFDEIDRGIATEKSFELNVTQRVWLFDIFCLDKGFEKKIGISLLGEYINKN